MSKWEKVKLGDVCQIQGGYAFKSNEFIENGVPIVRIGNLNGELVEIDMTIAYPEEFWNENLCYRISKDDILVAMSGATVGKIGKYIYNDKALLNQRVGKVSPIKEKLNNNFLYSFLKSEFFMKKVISMATGCAQPNISNKQLEIIEIPLPPIEEQKKIADILEKASNLISLRKKQIEKMDLLVKAKFYEMFGDPVSNSMKWTTKTLKEVCTKLTDGSHFSPDSFETGAYKYVTAKNIKASGFDFSDISYINEDVHKGIYSRCNPENGDVLYIKDGATTGIAMINTLDEEFSLLSSVALIKQNRSIVNGYYLCNVLNNAQMYNSIRTNMGGAAITRLTIAKLNVIELPIPPLDLQNQFASFVQQVEQQKAQLQQALEKLELNYKALMQQYFG